MQKELIVMDMNSLRRSIRMVLGVMRMSFLNQLTYVPRMLVWVLTSMVWLVMYSAIWGRILDTADTSAWQPLFMPDATPAHIAVFYFASLYAVGLFVYAYNAWDIRMDIRDGYLSSYLVKPMRYLTFSSSVSVAERLVRILLQIPVLAVVIAASWSFLPRGYDAATIGMIVLSVVIAAALWLQMAAVLGLLTFWLEEGMVVSAVFWALFELFGGGIGPLSVFPAWFQNLASVLPFRYMEGFIVEVGLGYVHGSRVWSGLAIALAWLCVLTVIKHALWRAGSRRYSAVGR